MLTNLIAGVVLILYLLAAWFVGSLMGLSGARLWVLRASLSLIGIVAVGTFVARHRHSQTEWAHDPVLRVAAIAWVLMNAPRRAAACAPARPGLFPPLPPFLPRLEPRR